MMLRTRMPKPNWTLDPKRMVPVGLLAVLVVATLFAVFGVGAFVILFVVVRFGYVFYKNPSRNEKPLESYRDILSSNKNAMTESMSFGGGIPKQIGSAWRVMKWVVGLLLVVWIISWFVVVINAGETGVYSLFGKVRDEELRSGFHLVNPLATVTRMSIRTEQYTMSIVPTEGQKQGDDSIAALTKEGLEVNVDFTALYRLDEAKASDIYREVGVGYVDKIIRPEIRGIIRDVVSQYEAKELYSERRQEASNMILDRLKEKVEPRGIIIEEAVIRNVQLPPSLAKAIQEKLASEQETQRYDFLLETARKEADRNRIEAAGQRDAQKIINESLSNEYLNYLYIKELKDCQGTIYVPTSPTTGMPLFKNTGQ